MSAQPPPSGWNTAAFDAGYSPGGVPGLPTDPYDGYPATTTDSRARNALILGVLGIVPLSILTGIPAIVMGVHSLRRIAASDGALHGRAAAWSAIVLGCVSVLVLVAFYAAARG
jgi:hypothetical protein